MGILSPYPSQRTCVLWNPILGLQRAQALCRVVGRSPTSVHPLSSPLPLWLFSHLPSCQGTPSLLQWDSLIGVCHASVDLLL